MPDSKIPPPALGRPLSDPIPLIPRAPGRAGAAVPGWVRRARGQRADRVVPQPPRRRPLPDAQAIVRVELPELAPPYDDLPAASSRSRRPHGLTLVDTARDPEPSPSAAAVPEATAPAAGPISGTGAWPSQFAQVLAETLAGARPFAQLAPWTSQQARRRISQLGPMLACGPRPRVRRVIVTSPVTGVLEMTAIIAVGVKVHAIAVRLERPADRGISARTGLTALPGAAAPAAPASLRAARLRATAPWQCTAVEVARP